MVARGVARLRADALNSNSLRSASPSAGRRLDDRGRREACEWVVLLELLRRAEASGGVGWWKLSTLRGPLPRTRLGKLSHLPSAMRVVNIHQAKTHLSRLVDLAAEGEPIIIARAGKPVAKLVPLEARDKASGRRLGFLAGELAVPDDFDRMGEAEVERLFEGKA